MYKAKLQELCHQRKWGLPRYSAMKDGPDHMPSFKASVYVNRVTFTSGAFRSLKEAKNHAAMLAFFSFSSGSSTQTSEHDINEQIGEVKPRDVPIPAQSSVIIDDMDRYCKNQPQNNAQKNNLDPPVFTCKTEDLPPTNEQSVESPDFFNTIKEVDQAAAKLDLMSLSPDNFEKGDSGSFKTSLLRLSERQDFHKPTYKTMQAGSPHMPTFFSTVEVEGVEFHGKGGRSKKQAEEDAAKIAYIALKECGLNMYAAFSPSQIENKAVQSIHNLDELLDLDLNEILLANVKVRNEVHNPSFLQSPEEDMINNRNSSSCEPVISSSPKSSPLSHIDVSCLSI
ncbi:hypothetical protein AAZV13_08G280000 [Glycine max]|uniref:double-stranded RNA-binding protein 1-like n=1 Tax=Glycine max TaxID=3847 RepID=UPI001112617B|nr:double-stranded RNA-binding protein 1-like [Glycine max]